MMVESLPKLAIHDGQICYKDGGTKPIMLIGCSRWEALARAKGIWHDWGTKSFEWYEDELIQSGINYVRHGSIPDTPFVVAHCERMREAGIIVELTIHNSQVLYNMGNSKLAVDATVDLGNVFYDVHNEFLDEAEEIDIAKYLIDYVTSKGGIASAGAWGHSSRGREYSIIFDPVNSKNQIISVHREWDKASIEQYLNAGKPIIRNEYFDRGVLGLAKTEEIMRETIEAGGQGIQDYGFRDKSILPDLKHPDPEPYGKYLEIAGNYCKEVN